MTTPSAKERCHYTSSMSEARWGPVLPILDAFQRHLAENIPRLEIIAAADKRWSDEQYMQHRPEGFPSRLRGVYLLFDENKSLLYVGLAMWSFDKRVWTHDEWIPRRWIDIILLNNETVFLAPSLEHWLISRLNPSHNKVYKKYQEALETVGNPQNKAILS
jgi:hypothetical protein